MSWTPSIQLNSDHSFHYEILRIVGNATYRGADVTEVLNAAALLQPHPGDFEAFYRVFLELAERVEGYAVKSPAKDSASQRISRRDAFFRASAYYRAADFYLHGDADHSRIISLWEKQIRCFDAAMALLPNPGRRETLRSQDGSFEIPIIFYAPASSDGFEGPRPTIIGGNGFDGAQEEMIHVCGFAALERGYNFITYEGPGQPSVRRDQGLGFIHDWERAVTPVVDWLADNAKSLNVDVDRLGLWGHSMGGYLAPRAAAFEHRLAAVFAVDGVFDVFNAWFPAMPPMLKETWEKKDEAGFTAAASRVLEGGRAPTTLKWALSHGAWAMNDQAKTSSIWGMMTLAQKMTLKDVAGKIQCPVFIGHAEEDLFFKGQPEALSEALGEKAHLEMFRAEDGAGGHCQVGAQLFLNQKVFDWFESVVGVRK